ncbi:YgaP-like transmembrane domain [Halobaculum sp. MBLA0147]|uniref:YgaP-like transmembrane domain n=1 Tax=Halobaculum sp. MBLA0147 TaxID=3079934 RepID=UPI003523C631
MQKNLSRRDSRIRIVLGALAGLLAVAVLVDAVAVPDRYASYAGVAAVALLANGLTCRCGLYRLLGVSTRD